MSFDAIREYKIFASVTIAILHIRSFVGRVRTPDQYVVGSNLTGCTVMCSVFFSKTLLSLHYVVLNQYWNKKRYDSELPYQRPDLIEVMEIDLTTSTNVHTGFYISVRECLD